MKKRLLFLFVALWLAAPAATVRKERISRAAALEDVDQFFSTLKRVHPNLLRNRSEEDYRKLKGQTAASVRSKADSHDEIAVEELASVLYYDVAYFRDAHTSVDWEPSLDESNTRGKRFPAWWLFFENGRFGVAATREPAMAGVEVISINGKPVLEFLRPILDRCSGETLPGRVARFLWNEPFWYYLTNVFGGATPYIVKVRDAQGQIHESPLETLDYTDYEAFRKQGGAERFSPNHRGTEVEFFDSGATAHFMYSSFTSSAAEKEKVDRIFREVKAKGARNLILDLRGNPGGVSEMGEYIFRYFYAGKFRALSKVRAKASWDVLKDVPLWARPVVFVLRGRVVSNTIAERAHAEPAAFFSGHVYLLVDNGSYSMAAEFAAMVRDYKAGTIVGYETGGLPITFGGPHRFTLRHSRIPCSVAWTQDFPPNPRPGDDEHGVIPDVRLGDQDLASFTTEQDPVLAFTLRYIEHGGGRGGGNDAQMKVK